MALANIYRYTLLSISLMIPAKIAEGIMAVFYGLITSHAMKARDFIILVKPAGGIFYVIMAFVALAAAGQIVLKNT